MDKMGETARPFAHLSFMNRPRDASKVSAGAATAYARPVKTVNAALKIAKEARRTHGNPSHGSLRLIPENRILKQKPSNVKVPPTHTKK